MKFAATIGVLIGILLSHTALPFTGDILGNWIYKTGVFGVILYIATQTYCSFKLVNRKNPMWFSNIVWFSACLPITIFAYAKLYQSEGVLYNGVETYTFDTALYFSIVTFTTLGYGDIQPTNSLRLWAASEALLGYTLLGLFIALILKYLSDLR